jgi:hypothetical protein
MSKAFGDWLEGAEVKDLGALANDHVVLEVKHPCGRCRGTGKWTSYSGYKTGKCHACRGTGFFKTSAAVRAKGRASAANTKVKKIAAFTAEHKELVAFLKDSVSWNSFARSLMDGLNTKGTMHPNGVIAAEKMMAKTMAARAAKDASRAAEEAAAPTFDLRKIHTLFDTALANGKNKRALLGGEGMKITPAPEKGKNAGHLYVKVDGEYAGKIDAAGKYHAGWGSKIDVETDLTKIAADPSGEARLYGMRTGRCACCGRELTNEDSIKLGIGPICAEGWGL